MKKEEAVIEFAMNGAEDKGVLSIDYKEESFKYDYNTGLIESKMTLENIKESMGCKELADSIKRVFDATPLNNYKMRYESGSMKMNAASLAGDSIEITGPLTEDSDVDDDVDRAIDHIISVEAVDGSITIAGTTVVTWHRASGKAADAFFELFRM